jgi:hypothetical protein
MKFKWIFLTYSPLTIQCRQVNEILIKIGPKNIIDKPKHLRLGGLGLNLKPNGLT